MITVFEESDDFIWIPVAGKKGGVARAFLPFNGLSATYRYGYKAAPSSGTYIDALQNIQRAFLNNASQWFIVDGGKKEQRQYKARWRHGNKDRAPLLGPTMGWVRIPLDRLEKMTDQDLGNALSETEGLFAIIHADIAPPVLCETLKKLEHETARLYFASGQRIPRGQASPARLPVTTEQFVRDAAVVAYILKNADGRCECCQGRAPFIKPDGIPFLEVHHLKRLASGGSDTISNAIAVCPNCHRELHYGARAGELVDNVYSRIDRLQRE